MKCEQSGASGEGKVVVDEGWVEVVLVVVVTGSTVVGGVALVVLASSFSFM